MNFSWREYYFRLRFYYILIGNFRVQQQQPHFRQILSVGQHFSIPVLHFHVLVLKFFREQARYRTRKFTIRRQILCYYLVKIVKLNFLDRLCQEFYFYNLFSLYNLLLVTIDLYMIRAYKHMYICLIHQIIIYLKQFSNARTLS